MNGAQPSILEVRGVSACYSTYRALFGVSLSVPRGGIVALLGSNGAGKSTIARVISGLVRATEGSVRFDGKDITRTAPHKVARSGLVQVPEGRGIFSSLTVEENLRVAFRHGLQRKDTGSAMERAFDAFPILKSRSGQRAGTLSGGEQRILSLAKVLSVAPKLLIVDELSLGLAPSIVDLVYEGLSTIRKGGTALLVVEQQIDRALGIADTAILLAHGSVAWSGPSAEAGTAMEQLLGGTAMTAAPEPPGQPAGAAATPPLDEPSPNSQWAVPAQKSPDIGQGEVEPPLPPGPAAPPPSRFTEAPAPEPDPGTQIPPVASTPNGLMAQRDGEHYSRSLTDPPTNGPVTLGSGWLSNDESNE